MLVLERDVVIVGISKRSKMVVMENVGTIR